MRRIGTILAGLFCLIAIPSFAAHTQVRLILSADPAKPGDTIWAGVDMKMEPAWHTYWKNPGEAGIPTKIEWQLPPGVTAGEIQWPLPVQIPPAEVTTYGYNDEVVLLVPLKLAADLKPGPLDLKAKVSWLECKEACLPGNGDIEATLNIGPETKLSADAAVIESWKGKVPKSAHDWSIHVWWDKPAKDDTRPIIIAGSYTGSMAGEWSDEFVFFPDANDNFEIQAATEKVSDANSLFCFRKTVKKYSGDWPNEISGVIIAGSGNSRTGFEVKLPVREQAPASERESAASTATASAVSTPALPNQSLWQMLLYAFIGGLILNIMPCVLPVIALKILGFVSEVHGHPRRIRALGGIYAVGVLFSFLVFAAFVIGIKAAGNRIGWGFQFGNPVFVVSLTTLVTLVALNLFGVFEVMLGGRVLGAAGTLAARQGAAGAFFNGVLATALATPCTAPILATALGFAILQNKPAIVLLIFLTVGLGLAAPYILLSWNPGWLRFLPKPGAWMEKFKLAMGFPMAGTAVWLFTIASDDLDKSGTLRFGLFLIALAAAAWIWGEFVQRGVKRRGLAMLTSVLLVTGFGAFAYFRSPDQIDWQPWTPDAVAQAHAAGRPVLVDFTADWCTTCQVNKRFAIEIPTVRAKLKKINAVAFVGDYTHTPDGITAELSRFNRAGVPLVLVYPKDPVAPPIVLPEILTPGIVLDALDRASH